MNEKYNQILKSFKKNGGRFTKQRENILKAVLENPGCTCKELYYLTRSRSKEKVSRATVYRTVRELENMGFIQKTNCGSNIKYKDSTQIRADF